MITNTWFKHEKRQRYTSKSPEDYVIYHILVKCVYSQNSVLNAHTLPGADADTDHNLLTEKNPHGPKESPKDCSQEEVEQREFEKQFSGIC